jgi:hypothetical protein
VYLEDMSMKEKVMEELTIATLSSLIQNSLVVGHTFFSAHSYS